MVSHDDFHPAGRWMPWAGLSLGLLFFGLAALFATGRIGRNPLVGLRTATTMACGTAWYAAHHAAVPWFCLAGIVFLCAGAMGYKAVRAPVVPQAAPSAPARRPLLIGAALALLVVIIGGVAGELAARGACA